MGWLITLGVLFLLAILPLGVSVSYDEDGPLVRIVAGPIRLTVFPRKPKKPKAEKPKKEEAAAPAASPADTPAAAKPAPAAEKPPKPPKPKAEKKGGSVLDFLPLVKLALNFLGDFRRKLRVNVLKLKLIMAGGDPCDLATNYGRAWAALGNLWPRLEEWFVIKKRDVQIECDFTSDETLITARMDITITLGRLLALVVCYAVRALKEYLKIQKKRKGGAVS